MNVKPKFVYYDIRRKQSVCLIMYTHENDVDTQVLEVSMLDNGEPIELSAGYTYSAAIVNRDTKALINDNISCELNDSGNVLIPIDNFHTLGAQDLLIELTITDSTGDQVLVTPFPLWIHVNASILDGASVIGPQGEKGDKGDKGDTGAAGAQGEQGVKGDPGATGADGFSPTATITQTQSGATVTITDKSGTTTANLSNGAPGQDYVLTAQDKTDIANIVLSELPTTQGVQYGNASN